jgi:hypothetical protein
MHLDNFLHSIYEFYHFTVINKCVGKTDSFLHTVARRKGAKIKILLIKGENI